MARVTYGELFKESLEETIGAWGDVWTIINLVNVYQKTDPVARIYAFEDWLEANTSFSCSSCGKSFGVDKDGIEEQNFVLCLKCRRWH